MGDPIPLLATFDVVDMAVFVTGGTGLVGVNLIRALVEAGERVRALVRPTSVRVGLEADGIEFVTGDVTDIESLRRGMKGCDRVYHLAGWVQISPWGADDAQRVNVVGTENVCRVCLEMGIERLVHTSSIAAVGHGPMDAPADEDMVWNLGGLRIPYYTSKHAGEQVVRQYIDRGLDAVTVNPSYVVGPFDIKPSGGRVIIRVLTGNLPGYPSRGGIGFVDVREVVEGMRAAMTRGKRGARYILSGENMTYRDYLHVVAKTGGVHLPRRSVPYWLLYPAAWAATGVGYVWRGTFTDFNLCVLRSGFCGHYVDSTKSRSELGVKRWPIDEAVAAAITWFEERGYVRRTSNGWSAR